MSCDWVFEEQRCCLRHGDAPFLRQDELKRAPTTSEFVGGIGWTVERAGSRLEAQGKRGRLQRRVTAGEAISHLINPLAELRSVPQGLKSLCGYFKINSSAAEAVVQMQDLCRS